MEQGAGSCSKTHPQLRLSPMELESEEMISTLKRGRLKFKGTPEKEFTDWRSKHWNWSTGKNIKDNLVLENLHSRGFKLYFSNKT